jgi:cell division cycle 20-like protein 1 (cofactor of APC complex)
VASGSSDSTVKIWDIRSSGQNTLRGHKGSVKALCWNPHRKFELISGGGTKDKTIKVWNTISSKVINSKTKLYNKILFT